MKRDEWINYECSLGLLFLVLVVVSLCLCLCLCFLLVINSRVLSVWVLDRKLRGIESGTHGIQRFSVHPFSPHVYYFFSSSCYV